MLASWTLDTVSLNHSFRYACTCVISRQKSIFTGFEDIHDPVSQNPRMSPSPSPTLPIVSSRPIPRAIKSTRNQKPGAGEREAKSNYSYVSPESASSTLLRQHRRSTSRTLRAESLSRQGHYAIKCKHSSRPLLAPALPAPPISQSLDLTHSC